MATTLAAILAVDDTPANLGLLFDLLDNAGFEVLVVPKWAECYQTRPKYSSRYHPVGCHDAGHGWLRYLPQVKGR